MEKCVICGAETMLIVGGVPMCVRCDDERERRGKTKGDAQSGKPPMPPNPPKPAERRMLVDHFEAAVRKYRANVRQLTRAAGSYELDAFERLYLRCRQSHEECADLHQQLGS